ncbi:MAG: hypothetical protein HUJ22_08820 [Gracilimonas sp.]|uniref:hypothetical protein n=1 Tax=Gracilimonas sp. TaxID=1974203 RepID=UPI0019C25592|nr:hypothetical protein [Gracilimonas sp.]MBD3616663.1 hypothetical protein [Gracilimonas sp.]
MDLKKLVSNTFSIKKSEVRKKISQIHDNYVAFYNKSEDKITALSRLQTIKQGVKSEALALGDEIDELQEKLEQPLNEIIEKIDLGSFHLKGDSFKNGEEKSIESVKKIIDEILESINLLVFLIPLQELNNDEFLKFFQEIKAKDESLVRVVGGYQGIPKKWVNVFFRMIGIMEKFFLLKTNSDALSSISRSIICSSYPNELTYWNDLSDEEKNKMELFGEAITKVDRMAIKIVVEKVRNREICKEALEKYVLYKPGRSTAAIFDLIIDETPDLNRSAFYRWTDAYNDAKKELVNSIS